MGQDADIPQPGTINYIEGAVSLADRALPPRAQEPVAVMPGQVLATAQGKAEILLTPGIFFRLDDNSAVKMVTPNLTHTVVELEQGRAAVEVDAIFPENQVQVLLHGKTVQLLKRGFYEFSADNGQVRVFDGKASVQEDGGRWTEVKGKHEFNVGGPGKPDGFNEDRAKDDLYKWSSLRAEYMAQSDGQMGDAYETPGWYWNPYFGGYGFFGYPFWSPFGWGYGYYGGYYRGGYYRGGGYRGGGYRGGEYRGSIGVGGRGASGGFGGGGFHGGGGGHR